MVLTEPPARFRKTLPERRFKVIAFWTTVAGVVIVTAGLYQFVEHKRFALALVIALLGLLIGSVSLFLVPAPQPRFVIELYTRKGCSLCEEASALLTAWKPRFDYDVWEHDVDDEPALAEMYGDFVPVAVAGATELFRLRAEVASLERQLAALARARERRM